MGTGWSDERVEGILEGGKKRAKHVDLYTSRYKYSSGEGDEQIEGVMGIVYTVLLFLFVVGVYYLASSFIHIFSYLDARVSNKFLLAQFVALGALLSGLGLYFLREHRRMLYALLEMAFALVTGGAAIYKLKEGDLSVWLALAASTYLVVRSLENMHKAGFTLIDTFNIYVGKHIFRRQVISPAATATPEETHDPVTKPNNS